MRKVYNRIGSIASSTFTVEAEKVEMAELVEVMKKDGTKLFGSVTSIDNKSVIVQAFGSTSGLSTGDKVVFLKKRMRAQVSPDVLGRIFNGTGEPIDGGPVVKSCEREIATASFNPVKREIPDKMMKTNIPMIDVFNSLVESQKLPIFSIPGEPYNELLMRINNQCDADVVVIAGMGFRHDDLVAFKKNAEENNSSQKTVMFVHMATGYPVECLMVPDMALAVAEEFAMKGKRVLVLMSDMTSFADSLKEIAISLDQIPSNRGYPGSLYSDLAFRYEKAVDIEGMGSITILAVTTMPGDDVTHPIPDNTGYITEGQFYLKNSRINPFGSLSRLKNNVVGSKTREDHSAIMNTTIGLYSEALKSRELYSMGFKLSIYDNKLLKFAKLFEEKLMNLNVNIDVIEALDQAWGIMSSCFERQEVGIKESLMDKYWPTS
jgi:V/A-type H+/Na+-transporting ATPase subunit B